MKVALLFPGQGSQYVGMGQALTQTFEKARETYDEASDCLGWDVAALCFDGPTEKLNQTEYTQPALLATSIAIWRALEITPKEGWCLAGHSLGEYTALVVAKGIAFRDALWLVSQRGRFMQEAASELGNGEGGMVVLIGLEAKEVIEVCESASTPREPVVAANFNAPDQIVIAGSKEGLKRAMTLAEKKGARRLIPLAVSVPSHSPFMQSACRKLDQALEQIVGEDLAVPLINNKEAKLITRWSEVRRSLVDQLAFPLLWEQSIRRIRGLGVHCFLEVGPGRVLSGLLKRMDRTIRVVSAEDPEGIVRVHDAMKQEVG